MLNSMENSDTDRFCFNSKSFVCPKRKKSLVSRSPTRLKIHEISQQSQKLAKNVLNRTIILLFNCNRSFFPLCNGFSNCLEGHLFPFVYGNFSVDLRTEVVGLRAPNPAGYFKCSNPKD